MPRIQIKVTNELLKSAARIPLDGGQRKLQEEVKKAAKRVMQDAAKEFVTFLAKNVPVLTGEALGSVLPVARAIRAATAVNASLKRAGKRPAARGRVNIAAGVAQGGPAKPLEFANGQWIFAFETDVAHFIFRENNFVATDRNPQRLTPWHIVKEADERMRRNISQNLNKRMRQALKKVFPQIPFPGTTRITTGGTDLI